MNTGNNQEMEICEETRRAVLQMLRKERKQMKKQEKQIERQKEEERKQLELKLGPTDNRVRIISREFANKLIDSHNTQTNNYCEFPQLTADDFPSLDQNVYKPKNVTDMNCSTFENGVTTEQCVSSSIDVNVPTETNELIPEPMNRSGDKNYNVQGDPNDIDMSALAELDFIFTEVVPKKPKRRRGCRGAPSRKRRPRYRIKYDQVSDNCNANQSEFNELIPPGSPESNQLGFTELIELRSKELNQPASKEITASEDKVLNLTEAKEFNLHEPVKLNGSEAKELNLSHFKELHLSQPRRLNPFRPNIKINLFKPAGLNIRGPDAFNLSQPTELNLTGPDAFNLSQPTELNISGPNAFNLAQPTELNLSGPNVFNLAQPTELNMPRPNQFNLAQPTELNLPRPIQFNLSQPKKLNMLGPNVFNLAQPTELSIPRPNQFNLSQPKELNMPGPSKLNSPLPNKITLSEPNVQQVVKKTKRVNFGPVTVNILDMIQKSKSQLKREEVEERGRNNVRLRAKKLRQRERKREERNEGNKLDASQPDRQRGKHREFAKEKKPSKLKQLIQRDAVAAEEEAEIEEAEVEESDVETYKGKPKYSEFHINYSNNVITQELDSAVTAFLTNIVRFQENLFARDPIKGDTRRRYFVGFKVVRKFLLLKKIKILVVSPDIKAKRKGDTLDNMINNIVSLAAASEIPYVFALSRRKLGQITLKNVPICCVAVADCDGTEKEFEKVLELIQVTRAEYQKTKPLDTQEEQTKEIIDDFLSFV